MVTRQRVLALGRRASTEVYITHSFFEPLLLRRESGDREERNETVVDEERSV